MAYENSAHVAALGVDYILSIHGHRIAVTVIHKGRRRRPHSAKVSVETEMAAGNTPQ